MRGEKCCTTGKESSFFDNKYEKSYIANRSMFRNSEIKLKIKTERDIWEGKAKKRTPVTCMLRVVLCLNGRRINVICMATFRQIILWHNIYVSSKYVKTYHFWRDRLNYFSIQVTLYFVMKSKFGSEEQLIKKAIIYLTVFKCMNVVFVFILFHLTILTLHVASQL